MRFSFTSALVALVFFAPSALSLQPGDIPPNVAVRSVNGEIHHFYEKDAIEYFKKRDEIESAKRSIEPEVQVKVVKREIPGAHPKRQDITSDYYAVSNDGTGLKAFGTRDAHKRQDITSDYYPVSNDGTGLKAFGTRDDE